MSSSRGNKAKTYYIIPGSRIMGFINGGSAAPLGPLAPDSKALSEGDTVEVTRYRADAKKSKSKGRRGCLLDRYVF